MSWAEELYRIYELNCDREFEAGEPAMLPIAHTTFKAQIEITVSEGGDFAGARLVGKEDAETIIPNTGKAKTGKHPAAYPLNECLKYVGGDLAEFMQDDAGDFSLLHEMYLNQLQAWNDSRYTHDAVSAVLSYVRKGTLVSDCIKSGVLTLEENGRLTAKQNGDTVERNNVRFIVEYSDSNREPKTWKDSTLYNSFIDYNTSSLGNVQLCYALGRELPSQYTHPIKILNRQANAKLISSNDESGYTYRGRFANKEQAISISYDFSEKMHAALKWLIEKQGMNFETMTMIVWASGLQPLPDIRSSASVGFVQEDEFPDEENSSVPSTAPMYAEMLRKRIWGYEKKFDINTKVMVMAVDAASKGRASIAMFSELGGSEFLGNIERWHQQTAILRYNGRHINSFSLYEIARCAFGVEIQGKSGKTLQLKPELLGDVMLRLVPCVTEGRCIPDDIILNLYNKASHPLAYDVKSSNHKRVLETACGMIRKYQTDNGKGDISMAYDPNFTNTSYLYGCLLAIADKAESETFSQEERDVRITNARRYWAEFAQKPFITWKTIEQRLRPYLDKLGKKQVKYCKWLNEIMAKITPGDIDCYSELDPWYLIGYHHFTDYMYNHKEEK